MEELRAFTEQHADYQWQLVGMSPSQVAEMSRGLKVWPRQATMPKRLRAADPALQHLLLSVLAVTAGKAYGWSYNPAAGYEAGGAAPENGSAAAGANGGAQPASNVWPVLDLSQLGPAGKVGRAGISALSQVRRPLEHWEEVWGREWWRARMGWRPAPGAFASRPSLPRPPA